MEEQVKLLLLSFANIYDNVDDLDKNENSVIVIGQTLKQLFLEKPSIVDTIQSLLEYKVTFHNPATLAMQELLNSRFGPPSEMSQQSYSVEDFLRVNLLESPFRVTVKQIILIASDFKSEKNLMRYHQS